MTHVGGPSLPQERRLVTEVPGPRSRELLARKQSAVAAGVGVMLPVFVTAAGGGVLVDVDGNSLIDFGSGIAVTNVGNSAEHVVAGVRAQAEAYTHTCFMIAPYEPYVRVCEELNRLTPGDHEKRSALFNSGSEAVENAVKIARAYTRRPAVVVFDHAYHGRTNLTMALTAKNMPYKHRFGPFAPEVYRVPMSYPFREPVEITGEQAAARAISVIDRQVGAENLAAVLIEPIQGEGGFVVPAPGFLPAIAAWCRERGVVFIADEIQTGFARTGAWFACEHEGVVPDLIATAKGIAGGLPLSAVTGRAEIMDAVHAGGLGGTYGGNPIACAAALGAIRTIEEQDLVGRARRIGEVMLARLGDMAACYPVIGDVRGRGAMTAVEIVRPGTKDPDPEATQAVARACHAAGLLVLTCGTYGNVLRFLPPLVIPDHLLAEGLDILDKAFAAVS
ncbi:4-aminobutyrate--2-oxoglutarate transaminase [Carbonactinospora thermoautotrophica]|uniref:4-aminobutyrate aminotransferase n=1 Tax=Carbonactinospora thermoautotrophica TaxID=1469144 RepID=A0A132NK37_9ACTN|nr:4-aminobutyrate--2-oxoglutarate transaminase [Carbonactinospora thermoautotrophica]KWX03559.1 4-aminobutyrate aminotransferase [Carbonactinospora thermoautotrophica]KWX10426.1 4-aminobutyrate aminotransferase [Carbonactinospora thermoautotrophica]MCX9190307.1 4-aminobutyrate--2-oxoglutarate transaminase [Carbonactinospora thermoautotrophica]